MAESPAMTFNHPAADVAVWLTETALQTMVMLIATEN